MKNAEKNNSLLIVDDDTSNLIELTHILQPEYKILTAKEGKSALERAQQSLPDLILLDIIMPEMNGFDVLYELKKNNATKNIPVIFITGIVDDGNESAGLSVGAVDYIRKPFDAMVVKLRVRHQMQIINLRRDLEFSVQAAEMANQAKSIFLANMSHEIRTPMNAILGYTEILIQHETLPAEIEKGLDIIYSSCDLLMGIINDILDFSKIEAGKLDIMPVRYKVASMINDSVHLNMMRIESKPIIFELQIDEKIPAKLIGDELRIKQILNNLLSNAFKYTDSGKVTLSVDAEFPPELAHNNQVLLVLSIRDTGHGITKEQMDIMFNEYLRFNQSNVEGTGLGLAITQRLLSLMDGTIHVESKPGKGSLFIVRLPQEIEDKEAMGKEVADNLRQFRRNYMKQGNRGQISRDPMPYGSVLIVDDVETNIYVAVGLLKLYRLHVDTAMNGHAALNKIKAGKHYDVIFMDHMMPEMDGMETTRRIRDWGYTAPIVALTANAVAGQADMFMRSGFDDFISKPIDIRQLDSILNQLVRGKQPPEVIEAARLHHAPNGVSANLRADSFLIESFIRDAHKAIAWLEEQCSQNAVFENEEAVQKFTVIVHGIKGALGNINEAELVELAGKLEQGGRDRNIPLLTDSTPCFILKLRALTERLEANKNENEMNNQSIDEDIESLCNKLKMIQQMAADYNRKGTLDILAEIKQCSRQTKVTLDRIREHVIHSEFEEAEKMAAACEATLSGVLRQQQDQP